MPSIVEHALSSDDTLLLAPVVEMVVERDARFGYLNVQQLGAKHVATGLAFVDRRGGRDVHCIGRGRSVASRRGNAPTADSIGRGATGVLQALYFGSGDQLLDFRTFQDHAARDTTSNLLFKGVIDDRANRCTPGSSTCGPMPRAPTRFQTNRNIKLSDDAWAESVPNLQIENNDVKCSHASTVGPVDEDQRFYLESRGLHPSRAERFIVAGFFDEVLDALPVAAARPLVAARDHRQAAARRRRDPVRVVCGRRARTPATARRFDVGTAPHRAGAHRRRLLRHRRHVLACRLLAVRRRGRLEERTLECWKHGSQFSVEDGHPVSLAGDRVRARLQGRASKTARVYVSIGGRR